MRTEGKTGARGAALLCFVSTTGNYLYGFLETDGTEGHTREQEGQGVGQSQLEHPGHAAIVGNNNNTIGRQEGKVEPLAWSDRGTRTETGERAEDRAGGKRREMRERKGVSSCHDARGSCRASLASGHEV
jgi:hypothetical protein